jgi:RNA polymerase sigma factor (sigma-70 family)
VTGSEPTETIEYESTDLMDAVWQAHAPAALRYATVLVGPHDAHDITVDAFVRVSRSPGWAAVDHPGRYLMRAVTNAAHDHHRRRERRWARDLAALAPGDTPAVEPTIDVIRHLARLSVQQRAVVFLAYWEDLSEPAIAQLLGVSTGTVHRNL